MIEKQPDPKSPYSLFYDSWRQLQTQPDDVYRGELEKTLLHYANVCVCSCVKRFNLPILDEGMMGEGIMALVKAASGFDPDQGNSFGSYAFWRVRGALIDYLRAQDVLSRGQRKKLRALEEREFKNGNGDDLNLNERIMLVDLGSRSQISLDAFIRGEDGNTTFLDTLPDPASAAALDGIEDKEEVSMVGSFITQLPARDRRIVEMHYFEGKTLKQIGVSLGLCESRVCQLHARIINKARDYVQRNGF
ncbi:MAG TPA: FliA/WhiG family RNA polymerase sigma factor [Candidatus Pacebacteria bacterium]|nr:FliA/WhiG family RNA polymerase sigma factor [Candidatus Paceibacterota bacterium]